MLMLVRDLGKYFITQVFYNTLSLVCLKLMCASSECALKHAMLCVSLATTLLQLRRRTENLYIISKCLWLVYVQQSITRAQYAYSTLFAASVWLKVM